MGKADKREAGHQTGWVYGLHAVAARLSAAPADVIECWVSERGDSVEVRRILVRAKELGVPAVRKSREQMDAGPGGVHQGIALRVRAAELPGEEDLEILLQGSSSAKLLLVLDCVTDPRNLGACLRSAAAFGVTAVIVPRHRAAPLTGAAFKAAAGAAERVPLIQVANLARTMAWLKQWGITVVGTAVEDGEVLSSLDLSGSLALVMGSEDKGIRRLTREGCDFIARIPLAEETASLNVSVAAGICLYEIDRQRRQRHAL